MTASRGPVTRFDITRALDTILPQLKDGDSEEVRAIVFSYLYEKTGDLSIDQKPDETLLFKIARFLEVSGASDASDLNLLLSGFSKGVWDRFYPKITEPGLEGLAWKPEKVFEFPVLDSEPSVVEFPIVSVDEALETPRRIFEKNVASIKVGEKIDAACVVIPGGKRVRLYCSMEGEE